MTTIGSVDVRITGSDQNLNQALDKVEQRLRMLEGQGFKLSSSLQQAAGASQKFALALGGVAIAGGLMAKSFIDKAGALEMTNAKFKVLTGSVENAQKMIRDLNNFALRTPFTITGIRETATQLLAYGVAQEEIIPLAERLGNLSLGNEQVFSRLAYAYGQVRAAGKLYGTELRQFTETGIPLIQGLADHFGVATEQIRGMVEEGVVGFDDVEQTMIKMTSEGGQFFGLMEEGAKTLPGIFANISDAWTQFQEKFLDTKMFEMIKQFSEQLLLFAQNTLPIVFEKMDAFFTMLIENKALLVLIAGVIAAILTPAVVGWVANMVMGAKAILTFWTTVGATVSKFVLTFGASIKAVAAAFAALNWWIVAGVVVVMALVRAWQKSEEVQKLVNRITTALFEIFKRLWPVIEVLLIVVLKLIDYALIPLVALIDALAATINDWIDWTLYAVEAAKAFWGWLNKFPSVIAAAKAAIIGAIPGLREFISLAKMVADFVMPDTPKNQIPFGPEPNPNPESPIKIPKAGGIGGGGGGKEKGEDEALKKREKEIEDFTKATQDMTKSYLNSTRQRLEALKEEGNATNKQLRLLERLKKQSGDAFDIRNAKDFVGFMEALSKSTENLGQIFEDVTGKINDAKSAMNDLKESAKQAIEESVAKVKDLQTEFAEKFGTAGGAVGGEKQKEIVKETADAIRDMRKELAELEAKPERDNKEMARLLELRTQIEEANKMLEGGKAVDTHAIQELKDQQFMLDAQIRGLELVKEEKRDLAEINKLKAERKKLDDEIAKLAKPGDKFADQVLSEIDAQEAFEKLSPLEKIKAEAEAEKKAEEEKLQKEIAHEQTIQAMNQAFRDGELQEWLKQNESVLSARELLEAQQLIKKQEDLQWEIDENTRVQNEITAALTGQIAVRDAAQAAFQKQELSRLDELKQRAIDTISAIRSAQSAASSVSGSGFAGGGFTGTGALSQIAGVVHRGEYVIPNKVLRALQPTGLLNVLEGMRGNMLRGFAGGGFTSPMSMNKTININNQNNISNEMDEEAMLQNLLFALHGA